MDVHPTKNVSIGIDPYPYIKMYLLFFHESSHVHPFSMDFPWVFISSIFVCWFFTTSNTSRSKMKRFAASTPGSPGMPSGCGVVASVFHEAPRNNRERNQDENYSNY